MSSGPPSNQTLGPVLALVAFTAPQDLPARLGNLIGVPYVEDGVQDERGRWSTFACPGEFRNQPGLNCSGFLVAAVRRLLDFRGSSAEAARDRLGDSGPAAPQGRDWDFGWDLVLNLSEGRSRRWLLPDGAKAVVADDAGDQNGFSVHDSAAWQGIRDGMRADRIYLATFLRRQPGQTVPRHHHVALLLKDSTQTVWLYQALPRGRVHRLPLSRPEGFRRLCRMFGPGERIRILEVALPD